MGSGKSASNENASRPAIRRLDFLPSDYEGVDLREARCTRCTPACNVMRVVTLDGERLLLCNKHPETQALLNNQRTRLGIPEPGARQRG